MISGKLQQFGVINRDLRLRMIIQDPEFGVGDLFFVWSYRCVPQFTVRVDVDHGYRVVILEQVLDVCLVIGLLGGRTHL